SIEPYFCTLAPSFVPLMEKDFPEIEHAVPLFNPENFTYSKLSIDKSGPVRSGACSEIRVEALDHTSIYT
ncbi:MAG: hypothetical protein JW755_11340, partial [Candidatus Aminicenantes bacterium]|nr:hypothetical protein [Candidatus Aminicenantes bacterium]